MPNRWTEWVKKWATDHDTTYGCALSQPDCKNEYRAKYGNRKKLSQKQEKEMMGMEDFDAPAKKKAKKVKKKLIIEEDSDDEETKKAEEKKKKIQESRERWKMTSEDIGSRLSQQIEKSKSAKDKALMELLKKDEDKKRLIEISRMMGEDVNAPIRKLIKKVAKKKPMLIIEESDEEEVITPAKKTKGRPRKYASKEEAYKAKIAQNRSYKQAQAKRIKELMEQMKNK